jgi:hypothetical protein
VQLSWSATPIIAATVPRLAIFEAYSVYTVHAERAGQPRYGLRLGFFSSLDAARQVARYVRSEFPSVSIVPVSHRECARAVEVARQRAMQAIEKKKSKPVPPAARESASRAAPAPAVRKVAASRLRGTGMHAPPSRPLSREELLARLGADEFKIQE